MNLGIPLKETIVEDCYGVIPSAVFHQDLELHASILTLILMLLLSPPPACQYGRASEQAVGGTGGFRTSAFDFLAGAIARE